MEGNKVGNDPKHGFHTCMEATGAISRPIFRATDILKMYPEDWKLTETPILKKPGKPDCTSTGVWRPIVLSNGYARLLNSWKMEELVIMCEKTSILPMNHFGGSPGKATTDWIHLVVKLVKDVWRRGDVASLLCLDIKSVFPSAAVDMLLQEMRMCGILEGHVEWFKRQLEGRKTTLIFNDFKSEIFDIKEGLDQGDAQSLIAWIIYNHQILDIFKKTNRETEFLFVDDMAILVTGQDFIDTHENKRHNAKRGRSNGVGRNSQLHLWNQNIPAARPIKEKSKRPIEATEKDPSTKTQLNFERSNNQVHHNSKVLGATHRQRVEVEGTDSSSYREMQRVAKTMQKTGKEFKWSVRATDETALPHSGKTKNAIWSGCVSSTSYVIQIIQKQKRQMSCTQQISSNTKKCSANYSGGVTHLA